MSRFSTVEQTLRDLESPTEPLRRRRSTGDIVHLPPSEATEGRQQPNRARTLSFHHGFQQGSPGQLVEDDPSGEEESPDTVSQAEGTGSSTDWRNEVPSVYTWGPFWLQLAVLGVFAGIFLCSAIALTVMLWYSEKSHGLCETRSDPEYIWRFAPAAGRLS
ncbi:hypothetical protein CSOJ01_07975 [Colletotrichum sojae]|uniref:Uncharacterized protein n=1 Tax=Colletotrichum sojae TaxID=2175907 RepID=A0A8H6J7W8_9PEZI|nr:hypothetical protein CSOJ01_07975 [Colletotrichum sojae]